jgi:hypothetical protein
MRRVRPVALVSVLLAASCSGNSLPDRPDAHRPPKTTSTTTTTTSTTTTTTTTVPPVPVPGPVKLYAPCIVPHGVSTTLTGQKVFCADRKSPTAKPFSNGTFRWVPPVGG